MAGGGVLSHIITSTPDPFCSCGSTTMDGVPGEGWVCSQCGAAIPAERVRHAFNPGPPVGNITVNLVSKATLAAMDYREACERMLWSILRLDEPAFRDTLAAIREAGGTPLDAYECLAAGHDLPKTLKILRGCNGLPVEMVLKLMAQQQPTGWWIPEWEQPPHVATSRGQYIFRDPKPTGLARKLGRRRKR